MSSHYKIVPYPNLLTLRTGEFNVAEATFAYDPQVDTLTKRAIEAFATRIGELTGRAPKIEPAAECKEGFCFLIDTIQSPEGYKLDIDKQKVTVQASAFSGFFYAIQTLRQMLPTAIYAGKAASGIAWRLPCATIEDAPRFSYRGQHLDVARHFFNVDEVKKVIDMMALHKLNILHWHLTDDQGWRIEIKKYPRLTEIGSIRRETMVAKKWGTYDGIPYGGYYTQSEIREVVKYAAEHAITIIPEIDLPGHMLAALSAYPELGCTGGPYSVWGRWGVADDVLCPGKEGTFRFIEGVLTEVMDLFPSKYIHIGGDECPKIRWEQCPECQARIKALGLKDDQRFSAEHYLQSYVMSRTEEFLAQHGRRIIGWDEILEGKPSENATIMSWRGSAGGVEAAKSGHDVIMTPNTHFYFDYYQSRDIANEPLAIGGYVPLEHVYSFDPAVKGLLTPEENRRILGVQANLWTEYIATNEHLEYMLLPRQAALAEIQWCNETTKNWQRFQSSLPHLIDIYNILGYNFSNAAFGVVAATSCNMDKNCVEVTLSSPAGEAPIYYTLDGSEPTIASTQYNTPIEIRNGCTLRAVIIRENIETRPFSCIFTHNKALAHPLELNTQPCEKYTYGAPATLVDGVESNASYTNGDWIGWFKTPLDVTLDMGGKALYSAVCLSALVQKSEYIFPPQTLKVFTSEDGFNFTEIGNLNIVMEAESDPDGLKNYTVHFPETDARYLRIEAQTVAQLPAWHPAVGEGGFLFVDELIVE